jgi:hypothetical protein
MRNPTLTVPIAATKPFRMATTLITWWMAICTIRTALTAMITANWRHTAVKHDGHSQYLHDGQSKTVSAIAAREVLNFELYRDGHDGERQVLGERLPEEHSN